MTMIQIPWCVLASLPDGSWNVTSHKATLSFSLAAGQYEGESSVIPPNSVILTGDWTV